MMTVQNDVRTYFERVLSAIGVLEAENHKLKTENNELKMENYELKAEIQRLRTASQQGMHRSSMGTLVSGTDHMRRFLTDDPHSVDTFHLSQPNPHAPARGRMHKRGENVPRPRSISRGPDGMRSHSRARPTDNDWVKGKLHEREHQWLNEFVESTEDGELVVDTNAKRFLVAHTNRVNKELERVKERLQQKNQPDLAAIVSQVKHPEHLIEGRRPYLVLGVKKFGVNAQPNPFYGAESQILCRHDSKPCGAKSCVFHHSDGIAHVRAFLYDWKTFRSTVTSLARKHLRAQRNGETSDESDDESDNENDAILAPILGAESESE